MDEKGREPLSEERNWADLPVDVLIEIFKRIDKLELLQSVSFVCPGWLKVIQEEPVIWKRIDIYLPGCNYKKTNLNCHFKTNNEGTNLVKVAVDKGRLEEFWIGGYCTDDLLQYVSERASNLRSLRLISCPFLTEKAVKDAVKKLKMLEEVEITHCRLGPEVLDIIGQECPLLERFKFHQLYNDNELHDSLALSIAAFMPRIRYLRISHHRITNEGIKAILRGCPNLEALDIRHCLNVRMDAEMQSLLSKLKTIVLPDMDAGPAEYYVL